MKREINLAGRHSSCIILIPIRVSDEEGRLSRGDISYKGGKKMKLLVAFDFDHTIIHFNSDVVIDKLVPKDKVGSELEKLRESPLWIDYMQGLFQILHKCNVTKEMILKVCEDCECTEGMIDTIKTLKSTYKADIIIISDSNTVFIEHWLNSKNIYNLVDKIYTNPAAFNADGLLEVKMYQDQDWCEFSTRNMCKSYILEQYLEEKRGKNNVYDVVAYVGDGRNDLCPLLKLRDVDLCFPRLNYALNKILSENKEIREKVKAGIHPWSSGNDILKVISETCC